MSKASLGYCIKSDTYDMNQSVYKGIMGFSQIAFIILSYELKYIFAGF